MRMRECLCLCMRLLARFISYFIFILSVQINKKRNNCLFYVTVECNNFIPVSEVNDTTLMVTRFCQRVKPKRLF